MMKFIRFNQNIIRVDRIEDVCFRKDSDRTIITYQNSNTFKLIGDVRDELWALIREAQQPVVVDPVVVEPRLCPPQFELKLDEEISLESSAIDTLRDDFNVLETRLESTQATQRQLDEKVTLLETRIQQRSEVTQRGFAEMNERLGRIDKYVNVRSDNGCQR